MWCMWVLEKQSREQVPKNIEMPSPEAPNLVYPDLGGPVLESDLTV